MLGANGHANSPELVALAEHLLQATHFILTRAEGVMSHGLALSLQLVGVDCPSELACLVSLLGSLYLG